MLTPTGLNETVKGRGWLKTRNSEQPGSNGPSPFPATKEGVVTKMAQNWRVATTIDTHAC